MLGNTLQTEIPERKLSPDAEQSARQADLGNRAWWCVVKCRPSTHSLRVVYQTSGLQNVLVSGSDGEQRTRQKTFSPDCYTVTQEHQRVHC